jgi:hypothetical protein
MVRVRDLVPGLLAMGALLLVAAPGCGAKNSTLTDGPSNGASSGGTSSGSSGDDADGGGSSSGSGSSGASSSGTFPGGSSDASSTCTGTGLQCDVPAGCTTSISGTVYDPAGKNPLYNVVVYIPIDPSAALPAIQEGTNTCNTCDVSIGNYVVATTSLADGTFKLSGVPAGKNIPIVVQIGKWRRMATIPEVKACANTALSGADMTRLPAKRSEGNIPQMALVTGGADNLGCFLKGIGLDPTEYSAPHAGGRLDIYQGLPAGGGGFLGGGGAPGLSTGTAGDCTTDNANCVWNSKANLEKYDIVLLACEGDTYDPSDSDFKSGKNGASNKTTTGKTALHDWLDEGGKVFATHFQYTWFKNGPSDFQGVATWLGTSGGQDSASYSIDTSFTKGKVFNQWLGTVGALNGSQIMLSSVAESVGAVVPPTQRWIYNPASDNQDGKSNNTKYMSFETPIGGIPVKATGDAGASESNAQYCGKAVFSDLHAGGDPVGSIPDSCAGPPLSPQLKALEFLFFDLSACVSNDSLPPPPPPPPPQ